MRRFLSFSRHPINCSPGKSFFISFAKMIFLCDRIKCLEGGKIAESGEIIELQSPHQHWERSAVGSNRWIDWIFGVKAVEALAQLQRRCEQWWMSETEEWVIYDKLSRLARRSLCQCMSSLSTRCKYGLLKCCPFTGTSKSTSRRPGSSYSRHCFQ